MTIKEFLRAAIQAFANYVQLPEVPSEAGDYAFQRTQLRGVGDNSTPRMCLVIHDTSERHWR
jgi:hypothetical protein